MDKYQKILEDYGLPANESQVYLAMLNYGLDSALKISKETEIKRPTVYLVLENLIKKDLVKIVIRGKKKLYLPEGPKKLVEILNNKKQAIEEILPELENQHVKKSERPRINFYEGKEGIRKIYQDVLKSKTEVLWFGSVKDMKEEFLESYLKIVEAEQKNPDFKGSREIINNTKFDKDYAKEIKILKDSKLQVRILPGNLFFLNTDNIIYDNKLIILSIRKDYFGVVIESSDIANSYRLMFELAWKLAVKI